MKNSFPNALAGSASPYLLQHAFNPVNWFPWSSSVLDQAQRENKLLVISIGYSACHWCHVMEHESFEDDEVAAVMNRGFISIKVDREERPDIDQVYMDAVQLMTGRGGWPLNVIALPDGRPIYGGTYFPKENWLEVLRQVERMYKEEPERCEQYGSELSMGMNRINQRFLNPPADNQQGISHPDMISRWKQLFDTMEGGSDRVPKFPMPDSYRYLLAYGVGFNDQEVVRHVHHTLKKMAFGGIYDQVGGGFARYSTDGSWKVPHFEKMLYDNALLVSLYADAYRQSKEPLYENIIRQTIDFVCRELQSPTGGFYSALDADSEGVEGKYYCWTPEEFTFLNAGDRALALDYFNIGPRGFWEHGMHIPLRVDSDAEIAQRHGLDSGQLTENINRIRNAMLEVRVQRVKPGLDDKILCSWNAMMLTACLDAYTATGYTPAFEMAMRNLDFMRKYFLTKDNKHLWHCAKIREAQIDQSVEGFLEDYAFCIEALLHSFYMTCDAELLELAINLADTVLEEFKDTETGLFFFTGVHQEMVLLRKPEVGDNVIPSSNAVIAHQFSRLHRITGLKRFDGIAEQLLDVMQNDVATQAPWFSRWARLHLELLHEEEIVVAGPEAATDCLSLHGTYKPLTLMCGISSPSAHALFSGRISGNETRYFVCREKTCSQPFFQISEAMSAAPFPR